MCSLQGKKEGHQGKRRTVERENLGEVGRGLADHSKKFLFYFKAERSHW